MAGLVPAIHVLAIPQKKYVDARDMGERSDAVLRTAMRGHDAADASLVARMVRSEIRGPLLRHEKTRIARRSIRATLADVVL
jgi:hypothetical protein